MESFLENNDFAAAPSVLWLHSTHITAKTEMKTTTGISKTDVKIFSVCENDHSCPN